jgi:dTDP-4-dehydrorhamnose reductase
MSTKVAIFGAGGQLGVELMSAFAKRGYDVRGFERTDVDITNRAQVEQCVAGIDPAVIVNSAAYNQVDVAEKDADAAFQVNALAVRNLALAARQVDARLVHFSTDYVFDGMAGRPYTESDKPHPLSAYAVSKYAGELYAEAYLATPIIIRTSGVFGPAGMRTNRSNFVELMLRLAASSNPIRVVEDHVASPAYAPALAARTVELVGRQVSGVFHIGGGTPISWFDFASRIFAASGISPQLRATNEREYRTAARRPKYSALANMRIAQIGVEPMPPLDAAIREYLEKTGRLAGGPHTPIFEP